MSTTIAAVKAKIDKQATGIKWAIGAAVVLLAALIGAFVIKGLVMLIVGIALVLLLVNGGSVLANKFKLWKYAALKADARKSPIETLQTEYAADKVKLAERLEKIVKFSAKCKDYKDKLDGFIRGFPQDAAKFQTVYEGMVALLMQRKRKYAEAKLALEDREKEIQRADAIWQMVLASADLKEEAGDVEDEYISKLKQETALDAVRSGFNKSMADLDVLLMEEVDITTPALTHQPPDVIDMGKVVEFAPTPVPVERSNTKR